MERERERERHHCFKLNNKSGSFKVKQIFKIKKKSMTSTKNILKKVEKLLPQFTNSICITLGCLHIGFQFCYFVVIKMR